MVARKPVDHISKWQGIVTLVIAAIAGLTWLLKLESQISETSRQSQEGRVQLRGEVESIRNQLSNGVLPVTSVRLDRIESELEKVSSLMAECKIVARK